LIQIFATKTVTKPLGDITRRQPTKMF